MQKQATLTAFLATERRKIRLRSARTTFLKMSERFSVKRHARNEPGSGAGKQTFNTVDPVDL